MHTEDREQSREEYLTIIAPTAGEVMAQFKSRDLAGQGYAIAGRIGRHSVSLVSGGSSTDLVSSDGMIAGTFSRRVR